MIRRNREHGVRIDWRTGQPRYRRDHDVPWSIEAAALEALDAWEEEREEEPPAVTAEVEGARGDASAG